MTKYEQKISVRSEGIIRMFSLNGIYYTSLAIELAKESMQREAGAYKEAYNYALSFICDEDAVKWEELLNKKLQLLGLVP